MLRNFVIIFTAIGLLSIVIDSGCAEASLEGEKMIKNVRKTALAGTWYAGSKEALKASVQGYMDKAETAVLQGTIIGIISPHAGHIYSGPVAGHAYKQIIGKKFDTVIIVAPNHTDPRIDFTSVLTEGAYETPLGQVPVNSEIARLIVDFDKNDNIKESELGHLTNYSGRYEHSIEIQLPFLQAALGQFKFVPIIMGSNDNGKYSCPSLAKAIVSAVKGRNVLIVASSDLSHFHEVSSLKKLDNIVKEKIEAFNPDGLLSDLSSGKCEACGGMPIAAVMMACRDLGADKAKVLAMANSGDVTGDYNSPVGYLAAVITKPAKSAGTDEKEAKVGVDHGVTDDEKKVLCNVVKKTLEVVVNGGSVPKFNNLNGKLGQKWGAFVTLTKKGQLRGCIGHIEGTQPLINTVAEMAKAAALDDPRFQPVRPDELKDIEFEISVLTPIRKIKSINEIVVGRDGIIITRGYNKGLLLPQVATEYKWDRETFLGQTCIKAGLPKNAWKDSNTLIEIFSAEVFSPKEK